VISFVGLPDRLRAVQHRGDGPAGGVVAAEPSLVAGPQQRHLADRSESLLGPPCDVAGKQALAYYARGGASDLIGFVDLLLDLPDGISDFR
jgi:hypothetical protein